MSPRKLFPGRRQGRLAVHGLPLPQLSSSPSRIVPEVLWAPHFHKYLCSQINKYLLMIIISFIFLEDKFFLSELLYFKSFHFSFVIGEKETIALTLRKTNTNTQEKRQHPNTGTVGIVCALLSLFFPLRVYHIHTNLTGSALLLQHCGVLILHAVALHYHLLEHTAAHSGTSRYIVHFTVTHARRNPLKSLKDKNSRHLNIFKIQSQD